MQSARSTQTAVCFVYCTRSTQTAVCFAHAPLRLQSALCTLHSDCSLLCARSTQTADFSTNSVTTDCSTADCSTADCKVQHYFTLSIHSTVLKPWRNYNNKLLKTPRLSLFKDFVTVALWYRVSLQGYLTRVRIPLRVPRHAADRRSLAVQTRGMPRGISGSEACMRHSACLTATETEVPWVPR